MSGDALSFIGVVTKALGNGNFLIKVDQVDHPVHCTLSGKIRKNAIRIVGGDKVKIDVSPYDLTRGRIVFRMK
jgi:translation initiation factor IF-1